MVNILDWKTREHSDIVEVTPRQLLEAVQAAGGDMDTLVTFESDGEPVYVGCYPGTGSSE